MKKNSILCKFSILILIYISTSAYAFSHCTYFYDQLDILQKSEKKYGKAYFELKKKLWKEIKNNNDSDLLTKAIGCAKSKKDFTTPSDIDWLVAPLLLEAYSKTTKTKKKCEIKKGLYNYRYWRDPYSKKLDISGITGLNIRKKILEDIDEKCDIKPKGNKLNNYHNYLIHIKSGKVILNNHKDVKNHKNYTYLNLVPRLCEKIINSNILNYYFLYDNKYDSVNNYYKKYSRLEKKYTIDKAYKICIKK